MATRNGLYKTKWLITTTTACQGTLTWASLICFTFPQPFPTRSTLVSSLCVHFFWMVSFQKVFPTKIFLVSHMCYMSCHFNIPHLINLAVQYKPHSSSLWNFLLISVCSYLLGLNIVFRILVSNTLNLSFSIQKRHQILHSCKKNLLNWKWMEHINSWSMLTMLIQDAPETPDGFWNLKTSLPATQNFHTDSHRAQCCLKFSRDGVTFTYQLLTLHYIKTVYTILGQNYTESSPSKLNVYSLTANKTSPFNSLHLLCWWIYITKKRLTTCNQVSETVNFLHTDDELVCGVYVYSYLLGTLNLVVYFQNSVIYFCNCIVCLGIFWLWYSVL